MLLYVVIMLAIQAFLLTKFGQSIGKKLSELELSMPKPMVKLI